ncbi:MAG: hypothetical protein HYZ36_01845 [Pedosphaera parvula]|nr:hypothetical protein [Pedosphaera parvula]
MVFQQRFIELLHAAAARQSFRPIPGAAKVLERLANTSSHCVALATGCWSEAARLKLASAGMCFDDYPSATADDAVAREDIVKLAIQRAAQWAGVTGFARTVYVGDGVWDARACQVLGLPFVGIARGPKAQQLRAEGAAWVCADFSDGDLFLERLAAIARSPRGGKV